MSNQTTQETLDLLKAARSAPSAELAKAWSQSGSAVSGITAYDLEGPAKKLYPVITPLRNSIPRVSGKGGIQANWRGITGINVNGLSAGVGGGNRGGVIASTTKDYTAAYKGLGLEDYATFEADYAAEGFDDVKALAVEGLLRSLMIQEERIILGGNNSLALSTTPTPTATPGTAGTMGNGAQNVYCVALTLEGFINSSVAGGVVGLVSRTNADGSPETYGGGAAGKSAAQSATVAGSGSNGSIAASVAAVAGAVAYAWFWGTAGNELLGAITTINSYLITATATGTQNISAVSGTDYSQNSLVFDGLLTFTANSTSSGAYRAVMATGTPGTGTPLTSDSAGGIVEIDTALKSFWDSYRLSPDTIWVSSQEIMNITKKVLGAASTSAQRFVFDSQQGQLAGGTMVRSYLNKFAMDGAQEIPIRLHPNMPAGTILFTTNRLPYPLSNVSSVLRILTRRDYYQIEWPQRSRKYEYGVYADEVLQNFFPPAFGMITNIANG
jgi:hypothetical protein